MKKLVVMDYSNESIDVYDTNDSIDNDDAEYILEHLGYNIDECCFMICNNLNINFKEGGEIYRDDSLFEHLFDSANFSK